MKTTAFLISFMILSSTTAKAAPQFKNGNSLQAQAIQGNMLLSCNDGRQSQIRHATCYGEILLPQEMDYFQGPQIPEADKLSLQALWENGKKSQLKEERYLGDKGQSLRRVNLWISTLSQRPLLDYGTNRIRYVISKGKQALDGGEFVVNVERMPVKTCRSQGNYHSPDMRDCMNTDLYCSRFFRDQDYCLQ